MHYLEMAEDFHVREMKRGNALSEGQQRTLVLLDIKKRLQSWDKGLRLLNLPDPTEEDLKEISFTKTDNNPVLIQEELDFDIVELKNLIEDRAQKLTDSQRIVVETVMNSVYKNEPLCVFVDARGGT